MKLEWIEYFVHIAQTESLTKTAEFFYLSQPTMSKAIRNLEEELGFDLFVRKKTGMYLSVQGDIFLPFAEKILEQYHQYQKLLSEQKIESLAEIEIAVSPHILQSYYAEILLVLTRFAPKSRISIIDADHMKVRDLVSSNPKICGLICCDTVILQQLSERGLHAVPLYDTPLVLCMSKTSRLANKEQITVEDLNSDDILALTMDNIERESVLSKTILKTSNLNLLMNTLIAGKGICILPQKIVEKSFEKNGLIMKSADFLDKVTFTFVYNAEALNENNYLPIILDRLIGELTEIFCGFDS